MRRLPRGFWAACLGMFVAGLVLRVVVDAATGNTPTGPRQAGAREILALLQATESAPRTAAAYDGFGVWIDAFDFSPSYQGSGTPTVIPADVGAFAELGATTVYLQAARPDPRSPGRLLEADLLGEFLLRAHARGIRVVGWYLPTFEDVDRDLDHLLAIAEFEVFGHRFDGVGVDIEFVDAVTDHDERSARLVELSDRLHDARPDEALGAIVPPPVQIEVINPQFWPRFPWRELDRSYDVWLPMAYWTTRTTASGYRDAYTYTDESSRRLRNNIGRAVPIHPIGGIGDETTVVDIAGFGRALADLDAVGGSIYDWASMSPAVRAAQSDLAARWQQDPESDRSEPGG